MFLLRRTRHAFSLVEMLVVIAVLAILAALLFPAISSAKKKARLAQCMNQMRQISLGVRMYCDDASDRPPTPGSAAAKTNFLSLYSGYKELMRDYVGRKNGDSTSDKLFACPADRFYPSFVLPGSTNGYYVNVKASLHQHRIFDYASYAFNGGDNVTRFFGSNQVAVGSPGLTGLKLSAVRHPARTVLVTEVSGLAPWSWHDPVSRDVPREALTYNDARNVVGFVDGHVAYVKIYWNQELFLAKGPSFAMSYDPPRGYAYQWSPD